MTSSADKNAGAPISCGVVPPGSRISPSSGPPASLSYELAGGVLMDLGSYQLEAFVAHLRDGAPLPTDADDTVANMQLIDNCYRAAGLAPRPAGQPLINKAAH